jgi:hypothetical protein
MEGDKIILKKSLAAKNCNKEEHMKVSIPLLLESGGERQFQLQP